MPHLVECDDRAFVLQPRQDILQARQSHWTQPGDNILMGTRTSEFAQFSHLDKIKADPAFLRQLLDLVDMLAASFAGKINALYRMTGLQRFCYFVPSPDDLVLISFLQSLAPPLIM